jgi:hypothetical protein
VLTTHLLAELSQKIKEMANSFCPTVFDPQFLPYSFRPTVFDPQFLPLSIPPPFPLLSDSSKRIYGFGIFPEHIKIFIKE